MLIPLLLPALLFGSKILSYNVYDRTDRVDIMLTFDTPYEGTLRQSRQNDKIVVKLEGATIESPKVKRISSPYITKMTVTPIGSEAQIIATTASDTVTMQASKTSDAFGLRLRFSKPATAKNTPSQTSNAAAAPSPVAALPTKPSGQYDESYMIVIIILVLGIVILLWLKTRIGKGATPAVPGVKKEKGNWLFKGGSTSKADVTIQFQKALDPKNRVVMLQYGEESYLVVVGNSNLLLDKFHGTQPVNQDAFEQMLQNKHEELDSFLRIDQAEQRPEPLQSYKEKASGIDR
jgi:hypothetical protein